MYFLLSAVVVIFILIKNQYDQYELYPNCINLVANGFPLVPKFN